MTVQPTTPTAASGETPTVDELRRLFLFEQLTDDQLAWLAAQGAIERRAPGERVYTEGEPATCFYVLLEGTIALYRRVQGDDVEVNRSSLPGTYGGATQAYIRAETSQLYLNSLQAVTDCRFYVLPAEDFGRILREWFPMAMHLLEGLFVGLQSNQQIIGQRERLLALGQLAAGLTHELNNPAAAAVRATAALRERVAGMRHKLALLAEGDLDRSDFAALVRLQESVVEGVAKAPELGPVEAADAEDRVGEWLEDHGVPDGWDVAPVLVQGGIDVDCLADVTAKLSPDLAASGVRWMAYTVETEQLMGEIEDSVERISGLLDAARQYSQLDRAPHQVVDVHDLLDSTLVMLGGKLGDVTVVKDYDRSLPPLPVYAAELNQVWTNLIHNALQAMGGSGTLTVRTRRDGEQACVDIIDTGPGVPPEIQGRVFEPFFTTKPVGQGTGLGLDISWRIVVQRHHGDLSLESQPGNTRFRVCLPLVQQAPV